MLETPEIVLEQELKEGSMTPPLEEEEEATIEPSKAEATIEPLVTISAPPIEPMKRDSIIIQNRVLDAIFKNRSRISSVNSSRNSVVSNSSENIEVPNKLAISNFDFLLAEVPSSQDKINYKLMNIRYRLDVELKVKIGTERMRDAIKAGGSDLKRLAEIEAKADECLAKVLLLQKSEEKYSPIALLDKPQTEEPSPSSPSPAFPVIPTRLPLTGKFFVKISSASGIQVKSSQKADVNFIIKVDGNTRAVSRSSKTNKWNEDFIIEVERASEIEIAAMEKNTAIGSIWFKLWELEEALKSRKALVPSSNLADTEVMDLILPQVTSFAGNFNPSTGIDAVFELEPSGKIGLVLNFVYETKIKRKEGVARRKNVQKFTSKQGHRFIAQQFYQVMKCAVCGDFLITGQGFQCSLCKYTCHKDCNSQVVIKCITKAKEEVEEEDLKMVRHRIPHRFESCNNLAANWCAHCGSMIALGKKQSVKCTECNIMAHKNCSHLVPNFCGLSSELINQMLKAINTAEQVKKVKDSVVVAPKKDSEVRASVPAHRGSLITPPVFDTTSQNIPKNVGLNDFIFLAVLGKGNFGKVMLSEEKYSKKIYAIKVLKKDFIIENDEVSSTRSEKRVFLTANQERHPFLVNLHSCFQTESRIYFVMEYVSGGDLMWHIQRNYFTEAQAKFYGCEVLLALEYFHSHKILYRDLKLDNILLSVEGHVKLADYGLCKEGMGYGATTSTFCGTPEFMAPEILKEKPYGRAVDWWAFGVLLYEMLLGQSPFRGDDEDQIFNSILKDEVVYPSTLTKDSISLLNRLLCKNPDNRIGSGMDDAVDIKAHSYFKGVNWDDVLNTRIKPPYFPKVKSNMDISNFDPEFTKEPPVLTPCNTVLSSLDQDQFKGFTHISDWAVKERNKLIQKEVPIPE